MLVGEDGFHFCFVASYLFLPSVKINYVVVLTQIFHLVWFCLNIINEENNKEESNNAKEEDLDGSKIKKLLSEKAKQQADEEKEEKIDKTEFAEKKTQQK